MLFHFLVSLVGLEKLVGLIVVVAVNLIDVLQRSLGLDEDVPYKK
jgi:hypothetical protein